MLPCSGVARFCQRHMAEEITKLEYYHQGRLADSLVEVFHRIDFMLKKHQCPGKLKKHLTRKSLQHDKSLGDSLYPTSAKPAQVCHFLNSLPAAPPPPSWYFKPPPPPPLSPSPPQTAVSLLTEPNCGNSDGLSCLALSQALSVCASRLCAFSSLRSQCGSAQCKHLCR